MFCFKTYWSVLTCMVASGKRSPLQTGALSAERCQHLALGSTQEQTSATPTLPLPSCVTVGRSPHLSVPPLLSRSGGTNNGIVLRGGRGLERLLPRKALRIPGALCVLVFITKTKKGPSAALRGHPVVPKPLLANGTDLRAGWSWAPREALTASSRPGYAHPCLWQQPAKQCWASPSTSGT